MGTLQDDDSSAERASASRDSGLAVAAPRSKKAKRKGKTDRPLVSFDSCSSAQSTPSADKASATKLIHGSFGAVQDKITSDGPCASSSMSRAVLKKQTSENGAAFSLLL